MTHGSSHGVTRRALLGVAASACLAGPARAEPLSVEAVHDGWYRLILELVRHTPIYSPPVASRAFAYLGIVYDEAALLHEALATAAQDLFANTGPTGQRAMAAMTEKIRARIAEGKSEDRLSASRDLGVAIAAHVLAWSKSDGGAIIDNLGFPMVYELKEGPGHWRPTSTIALQQKPLLPAWGGNRTFAIADGGACPLPPPPAYSEDEASDFYREAREVYDTTRALSDEQRQIARFWSDDPMLSPTPPDHWISIALGIFGDKGSPMADRLDVLARQV